MLTDAACVQSWIPWKFPCETHVKFVWLFCEGKTDEYSSPLHLTFLVLYFCFNLLFYIIYLIYFALHYHGLKQAGCAITWGYPSLAARQFVHFSSLSWLYLVPVVKHCEPLEHTGHLYTQILCQQLKLTFTFGIKRELKLCKQFCDFRTFI